MQDDDSQSDLAKKRTARVQLTNGALEARAYVGPTEVPVEAPHKTIEMRTVAVDETLDPRRKATVARGMGEALAALEGEIVDPETGRVIPPVDPRAVPDTPWAQGKRPTHWKGAPPPAIGAPRAGITASPGSRPGYGAYVIAGAIVISALVGAAVIVATRTPEARPASPSAQAAPPSAAPPQQAAAPPQQAAEPPPAASAAPAAPAPQPSSSVPLRVGPPPSGTAASPRVPAPPPQPPPSAPPKSGDRIF